MPATQARKERRKPGKQANAADLMKAREARNQQTEGLEGFAALQKTLDVVNKAPLELGQVPAATDFSLSAFEARKFQALRDVGATVHPSTYLFPRNKILKNPEFGRSDLRAEDPKQVEMRESIKEKGVLVPGIARWNPRWVGFGNGHSEYPIELLSGYSREFNCEILGIDNFPLVIIDANDVEAHTISLLENLQRSDPSAEDFAAKYDALRETMQKVVDEWVKKALKICPRKADRVGSVFRAMSGNQFTQFLSQLHQAHERDRPEWLLRIIHRARTAGRSIVTVGDIAEIVQQSERGIRYKVAIGQLPRDVRERIRKGEVTETEARNLASLEDEGQQSRLAREFARRRNAGNPMTEKEMLARIREVGGKAAEPESSESADTGGDSAASAEGTAAGSGDSGNSATGGSETVGQASGQEKTKESSSSAGGWGGGGGGSTSKDPTLAVGAVATIIRKDLKAPATSIQQQISTARIWWEEMTPEAKTAAARRMKQQLARARHEHDQWWAAVERELAALEADVAELEEVA